jgi:hypothetical protein
MTEEHAFEFETNVRPAEERDQSVAADTTRTAPTDKAPTDPPSSPQLKLGHGVVTALQSKFDAETQEATPADGTRLLLLGAALITYDVWRLSELVQKADADPDPPTHVEDVLPLARRLVERYGF